MFKLWKAMAVAMTMTAMFSSCSNEDQIEEEEAQGSNTLKAATYNRVGDDQILWKMNSTITYNFLNGSDEDKKFFRRALKHWMACTDLKFTEVSSDYKASVRIKFYPKSFAFRDYKYMNNTRIGRYSTDEFPSDPTVPSMKLYTQGMDEISCAEIMLHEIGHMLGFRDEIYNVNSPITFSKSGNYYGIISMFWVEDCNRDAYEYFESVMNAGVNSKMTSYQFDKNSVMMPYVPKDYTNLTNDIEGNAYVLSEVDKKVAQTIYPDTKNRNYLWKRKDLINDRTINVSSSFEPEVYSTITGLNYTSGTHAVEEDYAMGYIYKSSCSLCPYPLYKYVIGGTVYLTIKPSEIPSNVTATVLGYVSNTYNGRTLNPVYKYGDEYMTCYEAQDLGLNLSNPVFYVQGLSY